MISVVEFEMFTIFQESVKIAIIIDNELVGHEWDTPNRYPQKIP